MRLGRLKSQGPGSDMGPGPPGTAKISHHFRPRNFYREKSRFLRGTRRCFQASGRRGTMILPVPRDGEIKFIKIHNVREM